MLTKKIKKLMVSICCGMLLTAFCGIIAYADEDTSVKQFSAKDVYDFGDIANEETDEEVDYEAAVQSVSTQNTENTSLPSSVDLSKEPYFPPIRNQIGGSCAAWAITYYQFTYEVASYMNSKGVVNWNPSTDDSKVFSPKYTWNLLNKGEDQGVYKSDLYNVLKEFGSLKWSQFPQTSLSFEWYEGANDAETRKVLTEALDIRIKEANKVNFLVEDKDNTETAEKPVITSYNDNDLKEIKIKLNEGHPLVVSTNFSMLYYTVLSNGEYGCPYVIKGDSTHAVTIVGYNDNIYNDLNGDGKIQNFEKGAFKIANSWGKDAAYHNDGFIWIMYDALNMVSNANSSLPTEIRNKRLPAFNNNEFFYINSLEECANEMLVEVEIEASNRMHCLDIDLISADSDNPRKQRKSKKPMDCISFSSKSFNGNAAGEKDSRIFVFDYGDKYQEGYNIKHWIEISGRSDMDVVLKSVKFYKDGTLFNSFGNLGKIKGSFTLDSTPLPFDTHIKTGLTAGMTVSDLLLKMKERGYSLAAYEFDNSLILSPTTTKVATGMKIIKTKLSTGKISDIYYVVLFGDVNGDGDINSNDSLAILNDASGKTPLGGIAKLAADLDCNGETNANDSLNILKSVAGTFSINQNQTIEHYPIDCYVDLQTWNKPILVN